MSKSAFYASKEALRKEREDSFIRAKKLESLLMDILSVPLEEVLPGGFLRCLYCDADNCNNDPPEDDEIVHNKYCAVKEAENFLFKKG